MIAKLSLILPPRWHTANLTLQALHPVIQSKIREQGLSEKRKIKHPSVPAVAEKSLTKSDGDQLQAEEVLPTVTCIFQTRSWREAIFPPALHILTLSNGIAGRRPTSPTALGTGAKEQKCIFSQ